VARALLVGCGCRGRALGGRLLERGWAVRGTSRTEAGLEPIVAAGIEAATADPDRPGTVLDLVGDVAVVAWLLGSAEGEPAGVAAVNGERLGSLLERLVDTPVRGVVYEAAGTAGPEALARGSELVEAASERWRIPARLLTADPEPSGPWVAAAEEAVVSLLA
jgi:nucleoside-diphosphate-sugar epimerase